MDQQIQQALVDAMFAIAQSGDNSLHFDRTIECTIQKVENISTGEYIVRYLDGEFSAFDLSLTGNYKVGKVVYVQVPNNDISQKKIILGLKSTKVEDLVEIILDYERVNKVGIPLEDIYKDIIIDEKGIYGSKQLNKSYGIALFTRDEDNEAPDKIFQSYAKDQSIFMVSAEFKTSWLKGLIEQGNYGVEFIFNTFDGNDQKYVLDFTNMIGNPLSYLEYTPVYGLFKTDGNQLKELQQIIFFSEMFKRNSVEESEEELETWLQDTWQYGQGESEIFIRKLSFSFVEEIQERGYTLNIQTPQGIYYDKNNNLTLSAEIKYNGQTEVIDNSKAKFHWFLKDSRISIGHKDYNEIAGIGWKEIADEKMQSLSLTQFFQTNNFLVAQDFKCVVFYEDFRLTDQIKIYRKFDDITDFNLKFIKNVDGTAYLIVETNSTNLPNNLHYHWLAEDSNGLIQTIEETTDTILINTTDIFGSRIYYCTVCGGQHNYQVITLSREVFNILTDKQLDVDFYISNGGVFTYNTYGDLYPPQLGEEPITAHNISFNLIWGEGIEPENYEYEWIIPSNSLITSHDSDLIGSSITGGDQNMNFTIDTKYDVSKAANNKIKLKIILYQDEYNFEYELGFIKEGDPGTNGTSLVMTIAPEGESKTLRSNSTIYLRPNLWFNGKRYVTITDELGVQKQVDINSLFEFKVSIPREYKYLNPLNRTSGITFKVDDENIISITVTSLFGIFNSDNELLFNSIIQIKAIPTSEGESAGFLYPVSILYGVPVTNDANKSNKTNLLFAEGTRHVIYDSSGYNPQYSKIPFSLEGYTLSAVEGSSFILDEENIIVPTEFYNGETTCGAVKAILQTSGSTELIFVQPVIFMANAYSKSILNSWDGSSVDVNNEKGYILAPQIGAGKKEEDNTFTGVLMGTYLGEDNGREEKDGLYGFQQGITSFGLIADGTAFIGKPGAGRLLFDGEKSTITSNLYAGNKTEGNYKLSGGMKLDFDDGLIEMKSPSGGSITSDSSGTITINASAKTYPLTIGNKFRVKWDGTIWANNGEFEGKVTATSGSFKGEINATSGSLGSLSVTGTLSGGTISGSEISGGKISGTELSGVKGKIGGWTIGTTSLKSNNETVILDSSAGSITGATIVAGTLSSNSDSSRISLNGYLAVGGGVIGTTSTGLPNQSGTGLGMLIGSNGMKVTTSNTGMAYSGSYVTCQGTTISIGFQSSGAVWFNNCDTYGLYARFK